MTKSIVCYDNTTLDNDSLLGEVATYSSLTGR